MILTYGWEVIKDFPLYLINREGSVFSLKRGILLTPWYNNMGYALVTLTGQSKFLVHRLVALTFLDNPTGLPVVNHKDHDILNNHVDNLEWCTQRYNVRHGKVSDYTFKNPQGEIIHFTGVLKDFCRFHGLAGNHMSQVHNGKRKSHKGWRKQI